MTGHVKRYHPALVVLHWLLALAILGNLAAGKLILEGMANTDPAKPEILRLHMASGLAILVLMVVRLLVRWRTATPAAPHAGPLKWLALANHWALYAFSVAMVVTGLGTAQLGGLFPILQGQLATLPASFDAIAPFAGHVLFSSVLLVLIALHIGAVGWHLWIKRDNVLPRMWFGAR
jgi:cytochrome b561